jgi:hypothetical protein
VWTPETSWPPLRERPNHRRGAVALGAAVLLVASLVAAQRAEAGRIHLKQGYAVEADSYWVVGDLLYYTTRGETRGLSRQDVVRIEDVPQVAIRTAPQDVPGWQGARWNMTDAQVRAALAGPATDSPEDDGDGHSPWRMTVRIRAQVLSVYPVFSKRTERLVRVRLRPDTAEYGLWGMLYEWLDEQYGRPTRHGFTAGEEQYVWQFPTTVITLARELRGAPNPNAPTLGIGITYQRAEDSRGPISLGPALRPRRP